MHIHASSMNLNGIALQSAVAAERAAAAQRTAEVRRRLSDTALRLQAESAEEGLAVAPWQDNTREQRRAPNEYTVVRGGAAPNEEHTPAPFSLWA